MLRNRATETEFLTKTRFLLAAYTFFDMSLDVIRIGLTQIEQKIGIFC